MSRSIALVLCAVVLGACSGRPSADGGADPAAGPVSTKPKTVLDDQLKALEKAKAVQQTVDDAAEAQRKAIDDAGG